MTPSRPEPRLQPIRVSTVASRKRVRIGNRTLSKDESSAVQTLTDATAGNIPAVRSKAPPRLSRGLDSGNTGSDEVIHAELVRQLRKSGKGVEETLAAIKLPQFRGRGPLHMAAWAGRLEMCRFLVEELGLNVNAPGDDGNLFVTSRTVLTWCCWIDSEMQLLDYFFYCGLDGWDAPKSFCDFTVFVVKYGRYLMILIKFCHSCYLARCNTSIICNIWLWIYFSCKVSS
jgi:hypothetical protein